MNKHPFDIINERLHNHHVFRDSRIIRMVL